MSKPIIVQKFGSSVLAGEADLPAAVLEIYREVRAGNQVIAVVSAFGETTDELLGRARGLVEHPDPGALARLLETGEARAAASLGLALAEVGLAVEVVDAGQIGLRASGDALDAEPDALDHSILRDILARAAVVVVPGFCGRDERGHTVLLGRGGSDLTALFLARETGAAECRLLKDVDGLLRVREDGELDFTTRYATAHYDECLRVGGPLIQPKAVEYAARHDLRFTIRRCGSRGGTLAGDLPSRFEPAPADRPLRVALAGLGAVGLGVFRWLRRLPVDFEVSRVLVNNPHTARAPDVPRDLLTDSWRELFTPLPDLVIEVTGGRGTAAELITAAMNREIPVVSANKELLARHTSWLFPDEAARPPAVRAAASVGGGIPVLEQAALIARDNEIRSLRGVINGSCNFILELMQAGVPYADAVAEAQARGFAETDPRHDVSGLDSAHKLCLLSRFVFGLELAPEAVACQGLNTVATEDLARAKRRGLILKQVAEAALVDGEVKARVSVKALSRDDVLAQAAAERNLIVLATSDGRGHVLAGKGAGRYPTTCSVLSDAMAARRGLASGSEIVWRGSGTNAMRSRSAAWG